MIAAAKSPVGTLISVVRPASIHRFPRRVLFLNQGFGLRSGGGLCRLSLDRRSEMELVRRLNRGCFVGKPRKGKKVEVEMQVETVNADGYVFDAASGGPKVQAEHLVIMVNGIIGSAADWRYAADQFVERLPDKVIVHRSERNSSRLTFDGVDRMGERLAEEVVTVIKRWPDVRKISFVAHSLGGLVARYAIGRLYSNVPVSSGLTVNSSSGDHINDLAQYQQHFEDRIAGLEPMNFITFATPHLGSRGHRQLPFLCGLPFLERSASQTAHWLVGRSGKHLFLTDKDDGRPPLLLEMVNDSDDLKFMSALRSFKRRTAYANASFDHVVGWRTSSIRRQHELPKANLLVKDEKYPHIVYVDRETAEDVQKKASSLVGTQIVDLEEKMIRGLTQVPWERVDVSFRKSTQRYIAHNTIQVQTYWLNSDGADVVLHMIDNFLI